MEKSGPNWAEVMTGWGTLALALFTLLLAGGGAVALLQLREARAARNAQTSLEMSARWRDPVFQRVRQQISTASQSGGGLTQAMLKYYAAGAEEYRSFLMEPEYFEELVVLMKHGGIDFDVVQDSFGATIPHRWNVWRPFIEHIRREVEDPAAYIRFEYLAQRILEAETGEYPNRRHRRHR
jgi:hypothetical protein